MSRPRQETRYPSGSLGEPGLFVFFLRIVTQTRACSEPGSGEEKALRRCRWARLSGGEAHRKGSRKRPAPRHTRNPRAHAASAPTHCCRRAGAQLKYPRRGGSDQSAPAAGLRRSPDRAWRQSVNGGAEAEGGRDIWPIGARCGSPGAPGRPPRQSVRRARGAGPRRRRRLGGRAVPGARLPLVSGAAGVGVRGSRLVAGGRQGQRERRPGPGRRARVAPGSRGPQAGSPPRGPEGISRSWAARKPKVGAGPAQESSRTPAGVHGGSGRRGGSRPRVSAPHAPTPAPAQLPGNRSLAGLCALCPAP